MICIVWKGFKMPNRDAVSTIRGYYYQFDYTILKVLELAKDSDTIRIEGIEDVDLNDGDNITLHQCKCYECTTYNHSVIAPAVRWMIKHYAEQKGGKYKYYIYGIFSDGQNKLSNISVDFVKKHFLTYTENGIKHILYEELSLLDSDISDFISKLKININAESYENQEKTVKNKLCEVLGCNKQSVELYYCNALLMIKQLSTSLKISDRTISREDFVQKIKSVDYQFDRWLLNRKGKDAFAKVIRKKYFSCTNISPYARFFLIQCNDSTSIIDLKSLVLTISRKYSKLKKNDSPRFCPYLYLHGLGDDKLLKLKISLERDGINFCDGYYYKGSKFNAVPFVKEPIYPDPIQIKIINDIDFIYQVLINLSQYAIIYQFYNDKIYYYNEEYEHVKIPFDNINDIAEML